MASDEEIRQMLIQAGAKEYSFKPTPPRHAPLLNRTMSARLPFSSPSSGSATPLAMDLLDSPKKLPKGPSREVVEKLDSSKVASWIETLGAPFLPYKNKFVDEAIDGSALLGLTNETLKDLGVDKVGHRSTIMKFITQFNES
jgi:hypothetical protein